jgi:hypothetical protein
MAPENAVIRWGNYDRTLVLPSRAFEPDDHGRSYRLRPNTRSVWVRNITLEKGVHGLLLIPDTPVARASVEGTGGVVMPESVQTTNSWGCRGPEPDLDVAFRVLVLGDSYMQAMFIGDAETPTVLLEKELRDAWKVSVSVLNTGHLGYSPEQYYRTLLEYGDRFKPHAVVVSLFSNDFGDANAVRNGRGDWAEGKYWLGEIEQYCRTRAHRYLIVPVPDESKLGGRRFDGSYPGQIANLCECGGTFYLDPTEDFINEHLRLMRDLEAQGRRPVKSPLFNGHIDDGHFSPLGSALWAKSVARRMTLLWERPQSNASREGDDRTASRARQ